MTRVAPEDSLFIELAYVAVQSFQQPTSFGRDPKGLTSPRMGCLSATTEPAVRLHSGERGIQRSRA